MYKGPKLIQKDIKKSEWSNKHLKCWFSSLKVFLILVKRPRCFFSCWVFHILNPMLSKLFWKTEESVPFFILVFWGLCYKLVTRLAKKMWKNEIYSQSHLWTKQNIQQCIKQVTWPSLAYSKNASVKQH